MAVSTVIVVSVLVIFVILMFVTAYVIKITPKTQEFETLKIRFAAVTFTGIMFLVLITAVFAVAIESQASMEVFKTVMTGLSPIAGGIIGYLFSSKGKNTKE